MAENLLSISPIIEKGPTNEHILPIFLSLLRDENSDVRLNLFKRIEDLNHVIGIENLAQSIIPALTELSQDKNWRIKLSVVEQFPLLAKQLGEVFFNEKLTPICIAWLSDPIYSIREAAVNNMKSLTEMFGVAWADKNIIPKLLILHTQVNYLHRLTPIFGIRVLIPVVTPDLIVKKFVPVMTTLSTDKIPNIRMNVCKTIKEVSSKIKGTEAEGKMKGILTTLASDADNDVKYYAQRALDSFK